MPGESTQSQTLKAVLGLRGLIIDGVVRPGERVFELFVAERLGVSRTPARAALARLREEGFLELHAPGGYVVAGFSERDVFETIEIRGSLEGMAARYAAERGVAPLRLSQMRQCLSELDAVVDGLRSGSSLAEYVRLNDQFHELLIDCAESTMLRRSLERVLSLPFGAPNAFVKSSRSESPAVHTILIVSQDQHRNILEAIENREGARAQALASEHARSAWSYLRLAYEGHAMLDPAAGISLIRQWNVG